ncbi:MAG: CHAT domain-containing protein [Acidobacteria bacterium]|nr:CHAT domain-containing protein [Acidobacteriota bacterium]
MKGEYAKAVASTQRALEIKERVLPPNDFSLTISLNNLGLFNFQIGNYEKAEALLQRALSIYENSPHHPQYLRISSTLHSLVAIYYLRGDHAKAEWALRRALAVQEQAYGAGSGEVAYTLTVLAEHYRITGDYVQAELLIQRAVALAEKAADEKQPVAGTTLETALLALAVLYIEKGDYDRAEAALERERAILEKLGPDYPADHLDALARVSRLKGEFDKAEQASLRAIALLEKLHGPDHFYVAAPLLSLATLYYQRGEYAKAEPLLQRALAISQKAAGTGEPIAASVLDLLGNVQSAKGEYAKADRLFHEALTLREKLFGPKHPAVAQTLDNLATLSAAKGDGAQALRFQARANEIDEHNVSLNLTTGSERQKLIYLRTLSDKVDKTISLQARFAPGDGRAREQAIALVLQRKGRVLDAMTDSLASLRRHLKVEDQELLGQLNATTAQLSRLVLHGSEHMPPAEQRKRITTLEEQKEKLEAEISRRSAGFYNRPQPVTLAAVRQTIPAGAALVEFAVYRPFDPKRPDNQTAYGEPRYVAYVVRGQGEVQWKELGEAKEIDDAVAALRGALGDPRRKDARHLARALDEKLMRPVRALAGDASQLLISPDGQLNLMPFEALVDERERYLVERYAFTYLTSGRDLLRMQVVRESRAKPTVVADPTFDGPGATQMARVDAARRPGAPGGGRRRSVTAARSLSEVYFAPLGGTADEAGTIQRLFREVNMLTGARATESALKAVEAPRVLHVATHGFFLQDTRTAAADNRPAATRGVNASARIENPLLRSGLALAGANARGAGGEGDDGILTSLEASGLNLWGTKLVVLSACDTGLGEVRNGEGVYGLRRAFVLAGAESLLMSLWPVSDYSTRRLMTSYYENLVRHGMGRATALRQVQLKMIGEGRHPFYWANFIQTGEWANLEGERSEDLD